eukprot:scaffold4845_cov51-Attheya_sp.AAC.1
MSYAKRSYPKMTPESTFYEKKPTTKTEKLSPIICQYRKNSKYAHPPHPSEYEASASALAIMDNAGSGNWGSGEEQPCRSIMKQK